MLHRGQALLTELQGRAELGLANLGGLQAHVGTLWGIQPADVKARLLGRFKPHLGLKAAVEAHTGALHGLGQGPRLAVITGPRRHGISLRTSNRRRG